MSQLWYAGRNSGSAADRYLEFTLTVVPTLACCSGAPSHRATAPNRAAPSWRGPRVWLHPSPEPTIR